MIFSFNTPRSIMLLEEVDKAGAKKIKDLKK